MALALQQNQHDPWLKDFLEAPVSPRADRLLRSAKDANDTGDSDRALKDAPAARDLYLQAGNPAGAARSQVEAIFAYRRRSHASQCLEEITSLNKLLRQHGYRNFEVLADYESSNCQTMLRNFDIGRRFADKTYAEATDSNYPSLRLRALALQSAMASAEGRFQTAFNVDAAGLAAYWQGIYPGKRGFQFYSDAALTAEQAGFWRLAAVLQGEALSSLSETNLYDFRALAHYHLATSLQRAGDPLRGRQQLSEAYRLFDRMRDPTFLRASSEVELAEIEIEQGDLASAQTHLGKAASAIDAVDNFLVKLSYYNALANLERHLNRPGEEWKYLEQTAEIARQGFLNLDSMDNRWEWYREVDLSFHRLIELELDAKHDPIQALADWEAYRAVEAAPVHLVPGSRANRVHLLSRVRELRTSTLLSFIVLPGRVVIWLADNRNIHVYSSAVDSAALKNDAETFLRLCSDKNSSAEKVNEAGSRLYQQLLQPVEHELVSSRNLAIEADGFLSRIPWPALVAGNGQYLAERYMTISTPGLFFADGRRRRASVTEKPVVAYTGASEFEGKTYPPLPHAKAEADYVAQALSGAIYLREEQVTEEELMRRLPKASLFHFAGHGVSREHGGELLLAGKETFSAPAVRHLDLRGMDLVVLSACSTAETDLDIARSPNGLVQAFLSAGAREVVASRWDVDSKASLEFIKRFYQSRQGTGRASSAMSSARRWMMKQTPTAHPYYWSSFAIFGPPN